MNLENNRKYRIVEYQDGTFGVQHCSRDEYSDWSDWKDLCWPSVSAPRFKCLKAAQAVVENHKEYRREKLKSQTIAKIYNEEDFNDI